MKILVVDDEALARARILKQLKRYNDGFEIFEADNGGDALEIMDRETIDILFLDVQLREMTGFDVLKKSGYYPITIFVTAYDEYAVKAFEVSAIDYLLKPFSLERFADAMDKACRSVQNNQTDKKKISSLLDYHEGNESYMDRITVKDRYDYKIIDVRNISYFTVENGFVYLCTDSKRYEIDTTLSKLEENLDPKHFFRAHRKTIVNLSKIVKIIPWGKSRYTLNFANNESIHLSREKTQEFKKRVGLKI